MHWKRGWFVPGHSPFVVVGSVRPVITSASACVCTCIVYTSVYVFCVHVRARACVLCMRPRARVCVVYYIVYTERCYSNWMCACVPVERASLHRELHTHAQYTHTLTQNNLHMVVTVKPTFPSKPIILVCARVWCYGEVKKKKKTP